MLNFDRNPAERFQPNRESRSWLRQFAADEDGAVVGFAVFVFMMIMLVGGIGIDIMRSEMKRTNMQHTLDRAVLAAADLDQASDPREVVRDYFDKSGMANYLSSVTVTEGVGSRVVQANASMDMKTNFMKLAGIDTLTVPASGTATEAVEKVELSLALDISGSMNTNGRIETLKPAAKSFVTTLLNQSVDNGTSINVIPYAGQTNPGPLMFEYLGGIRFGRSDADYFPEWLQDISNVTIWFDIDEDGAIDPDVDFSAKVEGYPGSDVEGFNKDDLDEYYQFLVDFVVRHEPTLNADSAAVGASIKGGQQTTTFFNIVTGEAIEAPKDYWTKTDLSFDFNTFYSSVLRNDLSSCLEMTASDFTSALWPSGSNEQVPHFQHWNFNAAANDWGWCPEDDSAIQYAQNNAGTLHTFIDSLRLHDGTGTFYAMKYALATLNPSSQPAFSMLSSAGEMDNSFSDRPAAYDDPDTAKIIVLMTDGQITDQYRPTDKLNPDNADTELLNQPDAAREKLSVRSTNLDRFYAQCDLAKANGVVVYTIAFDAPSGASTEMRNCASTEAHFFEADSSDLNDAFNAIARSIQSLRLTQ